MSQTRRLAGLRAHAAALASATAGGGVFALAHLPMPWLLGAITGTAIAVMSGVTATIPKWLRNVVLVVLGLMIGATLQPAILTHLVRWPVSLAAVVVYVGVVTTAQYLYFRRVGGYDAPTAYFSAAPGGFMAMTVIGGEYGGAERVIALMHAVRIVLVVFALVLGFHLLVGHGAGSAHRYVTLADVSPRHWDVLVAVGLVGAAASKVLRLPGAIMIGPLLAMGLVQITGLTNVHVPSAPILVAEVVLGSSIGAQFAGASLAEVRRGLALSVSATLVMLLVSAGFAFGLHALTGLDLEALFLAFSPGGMSGISLIALALGIEPAFVTVHNMLRVLIILIAGPAVFSARRRRA
ncbi:AbrB family transcriptional regulator [Salinisphaera hydrothermalis]|uniref:AbrB family transcriptional regulator n=1 Tax=Salinisphaera hydrothermalis TaxID=563188 RepID=UPI003341AE43